MATATFAKGYVVKIDGTSIAKVLDDGVPIPKITTGEADSTTQDSGDWEETVAGRKKGGNCTLKCLWDGDDAGQAAVITAWGAASTHTITVDLPNSGGRWSYTGWFSDLGTPVSGKLVGLEATIKVTGEASFSKTKAALTTPFFVVSGAGTVIVPVAAATEGTYVVNIATAITSVTITPTSTSGTITVNGTAVATGVASGSITLGAAGTITNALIKVTETGKAAITYRLLLTRASS